MELYPNDTMAAHFLNPYGSKSFFEVHENKLWAVVAKGSKTVMYHSKRVAEPGETWRNGVGVSRAAESIEAAIMKFKAKATPNV